MLVSEALEDGVDGNSSLAPALERYGAEWVSRVGWDSFITGVDAPTKRLKDAVALLGEAVRSPALRPDDIVRRRDQLAEGSGWRTRLLPRLPRGPWAASFSRDATRSRSAGRRLPAAAHPGPRPQLPHRPHCRGDGDPHRRRRPVRGELGGARRCSLRGCCPRPAAAHDCSRDSPRGAPRIIILDRPGSVQSAFVLAHHAPSRTEIDLPRAEGMSDVLGGMFTSRLNLELREKLGYTYGVGSRFDLRRDSGVFLISTQVDAPTTAHSITVTLEQIAQLRQEGVTEKELQAVRESHTVGLPVTYASAGRMAWALIEMVVYDLPEDHVDRLRAGYEQLTVDGLNQAAQEYLHPEDAVVTVVGDAESLRGPLEELGVGPVTVQNPETLWSAPGDKPAPSR